MRKSFITNLGFLIFLNLLVKPFWILGIDRTVQNVTGPVEYGTYFALFSFAYLFQVLLDFGINNFNIRTISQQPERITNFFSSALIAKLLLSALYAGVVCIAAFGMQFNNQQIHILLLLILFQILMSFYAFMRSNIAAMHLFKIDSMLSVSDKMLSSILCGILLWGNIPGFNFTIESFLCMQIISYCICIAVAAFIIVNKSISINWTLNKAAVKEIITKSLPYALLGFLMTAYYRIDAVMIERMLPNGSMEAGIYASAFRLLDALSNIGFLVAGLLLPMFSRMLQNNVSIKPLFVLSYKFILIATGAAGISFIFYRNQIMHALYTDADNYYGSIFGWLMICFISMSIIYIYGTLLTANGSLKQLNLIAFSGLVINISLNVFLIPEYGALGAAVATVLTQLLLTAAHIYLTNKIFILSGQGTLFIQTVSLIGIIIVINYILGFASINWIARLITAIFLSVASSFPVKLFRLKEAKSLFKQLKTG